MRRREEVLSPDVAYIARVIMRNNGWRLNTLFCAREVMPVPSLNFEGVAASIVSIGV